MGWAAQCRLAGLVQSSRRDVTLAGLEQDERSNVYIILYNIILLYIYSILYYIMLYNII